MADSKIPVRREFEFTEAEANLADELQLDLQVSAAQRLTSVVSRFNSAIKNITEAGVILLSVKAECEHGEFGEKLEQFGITSQRASEAMRYAQFTACLPSKDRAKVLELPKKRVLALASTEPQVIEAALNDDELFHDLSTMDYQSMRKKLRQLESRTTDLEVELDTERAKSGELRNKLNQRFDTGPYPDFVLAARHEAAAQTGSALLNVDDLQRIFTELSTVVTTDQASHNIALRSLYTHVNALSARCYQLVNDIRATCPDALGEVTADLLYSDDELAAAIADRDLMMREHEQEKQIRENEREAAKPKGRGRPKKSKQ